MALQEVAFQTALTVTTPVIIAQPSGVVAVIRDGFITNALTGNVIVAVFLDINGTTFDNTTLLTSVTLAKDSSISFAGGFIVVPDGGSLAVSADVINQVTVYVAGFTR